MCCEGLKHNEIRDEKETRKRRERDEKESGAEELQRLVSADERY